MKSHFTISLLLGMTGGYITGPLQGRTAARFSLLDRTAEDNRWLCGRNKKTGLLLRAKKKMKREKAADWGEKKNVNEGNK